MTEPYLPANGAEGDAFTEYWCGRCALGGPDMTESPEVCPIFSKAERGEQPDEWRMVDGVPTCTAWR